MGRKRCYTQLSDVADSFWSRVKKGDSCWEWQGTRHPTGYGFVRFTCLAKSMLQTHRLAWILTYGEIPEGFCVCHKCDNPPCCRPDHLFLGTTKDNVRDMILKGRSVSLSGDNHWTRKHPGSHSGEKNTHASLTWNDIREIRRLSSKGITTKELSNRFKVTTGHIRKIVNNFLWKETSLCQG